MSDNVEDNCACPFVYFGRHKSSSRNWNPDCPLHNINTVWYEENMREKHAAFNKKMGWENDA